MNEKQRSTLQKFHTDLVKDIIPNKNFLGEFIESGILDFDLQEEILSEKTDSDKNAKFLSILPRRGPKAFQILLKVLDRTAPWLKEKLETFHNKQKGFNGDVESLFTSPQTDVPSNETSPKRLCVSLLDTEVQTDAVEDETKVKWGKDLGDIYLNLVSYLYSQGIREFEIAVSEVDPDLIKRVIKVVVNHASMKESKLSKIASQFEEQAKQIAEGDVVQMVENLFSDRESLRMYLQRKDQDVMMIEKEHQEKLAELTNTIVHLEEVIDKERELNVELNDDLQAKSEEIKRLIKAEEERQAEPLQKRVHNLITDVTKAKNINEEQLCRTETEHKDLIEDTHMLENLLHHLKTIHYHVTQERRAGLRQNREFKTPVHGIRNYHGVRTEMAYDGMITSDASVNGLLVLHDSSGRNGQTTNPSPRGNRTTRQTKNGRRLSRSPQQPNRLKTPRYQTFMNSTEQENRPTTRQSSNLSRSLSRQGTDASVRSGTRLSANHPRSISKQGSDVSMRSISTPGSSRQPTRMSYQNPCSSRPSSSRLSASSNNLQTTPRSRIYSRNKNSITPRVLGEKSQFNFGTILKSDMHLMIDNVS